MNEHDTDYSGLWKHVHGEADPAETAALGTRAETDEVLRRELNQRRQLDARVRRLLKLSARGAEDLEARLAELWEREQASEDRPERAGTGRGLLLFFRRPAVLALAATLMLLLGSITMRPEGLVWMAASLETGGERGPAEAAEPFYSPTEMRAFAEVLQASVAAAYAERDGPSGWSARWSGRRRYVRPAIRQFPDGRLLATLEAYPATHAPPVGAWSEPFANAADFELNAEDWAGRVAEEIIAGSTR